MGMICFLEWAGSSPFQHKTNLEPLPSMLTSEPLIDMEFWNIWLGQGQGWQTRLSHIINKVISANSDHYKGKKTQINCNLRTQTITKWSDCNVSNVTVLTFNLPREVER
jgi:hypothetical protein